MAVLDRLRNQELTARLSNADPHTSDHRLISSPSVEDTIYDLTQRKRMNLALDELRSCCRTEKALKSFERFETQLRKRREKDKTTKRSLVGDDRSISGSDEHSVHKSNKNFASMKSKFWWPTVSEPAVLTGNADSRKVSQRKSDYDSQLLMSRRPGLAKSHTTGDLAQMGASGGKARGKGSLPCSILVTAADDGPSRLAEKLASSSSPLHLRKPVTSLFTSVERS